MISGVYCVAVGDSISLWHPGRNMILRGVKERRLLAAGRQFDLSTVRL